MVELSDLLDRAIEIAKAAHVGQVDKAGKPYINHPLYVMNAMETLEEKIVGVLHDVIEDSHVTLKDLTAAGFPENIVEAVDAITRRSEETYKAYLDRVMTNSIALNVKIADMTHNADISRIPKPNDRDIVRVKKYQKNISKLQKAKELLTSQL